MDSSLPQSGLTSESLELWDSWSYKYRSCAAHTQNVSLCYRQIYAI